MRAIRVTAFRNLMHYRLLLIFALPALATALAQDGQNSEAARGAAVQNRVPLQPNAFNPLPLGSIHPDGWLRRREELQAGGLTGHLDEFWSDVGPNSGWLGGFGRIVGTRSLLSGWAPPPRLSTQRFQTNREGAALGRLDAQLANRQWTIRSGEE